MLKMNAFSYGLDKTMCEFSTTFDKATNGQTDTDKTRNVESTMSLLKIVGEKLLII